MNYKLDPPERPTPGPAQHPGGFVLELIKSYGLTKVKAAELLGVERAGFSHTLAGKYAVTADLAYKLEALTGVDADLLIAMQAAYERDRDRPKREQYKREIKRLEAPAD
jgi:antitoxin HigA-1